MMPTGYTSKVQDGEITNLEEFALYCARAFGATITMRDAPMDEKVPERFEPYTKYNDERIEEAEAILKEVPEFTKDQCSIRAEEEFRQELDAHLQRSKKKREAKARYEEMLELVRGWEPKPTVSNLKAFMIEQLEKSIDFDCQDYGEEEEIVRLTAEEWRKKTLQKASRDLKYHKTAREEEIERTEKRNKWLQDLRESLK